MSEKVYSLENDAPEAAEAQEVTRAARKTTSSGRKTTTSSKRKTTASSAGKKTTSSTAKKKTAAKKTSTQLKLTAAEKKLVQNFRKCNLIEKKVIQSLTEAASGGIDLSGILSILGK